MTAIVTPAPGIAVTDGTHTVDPARTIRVEGLTVSQGAGDEADVAVVGGQGQVPTLAVVLDAGNVTGGTAIRSADGPGANGAQLDLGVVSGLPQNEIQRIEAGGDLTGGDWGLGIWYVSGAMTLRYLDWNITAEALQGLLTAAGKGDIHVTGGPTLNDGPFQFEWTGADARAYIGPMQVYGGPMANVCNGLSGSSPVVVQVQHGTVGSPDGASAALSGGATNAADGAGVFLGGADQAGGGEAWLAGGEALRNGAAGGDAGLNSGDGIQGDGTRVRGASIEVTPGQADGTPGEIAMWGARFAFNGSPVPLGRYEPLTIGSGPMPAPFADPVSATPQEVAEAINMILAAPQLVFSGGNVVMVEMLPQRRLNRARSRTAGTQSSSEVM